MHRQDCLDAPSGLAVHQCVTIPATPLIKKIDDRVRINLPVIGFSIDKDRPSAQITNRVRWSDERNLAEVAYAVQSGALWVATNTDATLPTERGVAPGNGALVSAVRQAVGVDPVVVDRKSTRLNSSHL